MHSSEIVGFTSIVSHPITVGIKAYARFKAIPELFRKTKMLPSTIFYRSPHALAGRRA
jgi:hypothetical protein